jgi:hypothetical protein
MNPETCVGTLNQCRVAKGMQIPLGAAVFGRKSSVAQRRSFIRIGDFARPSKALFQAVEEPESAW